MIKLVTKIFISLLLITQFSFASYIDTDAEMAVVIDADTGKVLFEKDKGKKTYPASMTKIMTTLIVFEKLSNGTLALDDKFLVSERAWKEREGSSMFVEVDKEIRVEDLLRGIIVQSGNDACIVIAENIAGTEDAFAKMMTDRGIEIGLKNTNFTNSTGMHNSKNYSTVYDLALLSQYLINEFPEYYHLFGETEFEWSGIKQNNRNPLLYKNIGADGIKTGYLAVEKYSLASSLERNGRRLIAVGSGFDTKKSRSRESTKLLTYGLTNFDLVKIAKAKEPFHNIEVWLGKDSYVKVYTNEDVYKTIKKAKKKLLKVSVIYEGPVVAPIKKDQKIATLKVVYDQEFVGEYDLLSFKNIKKVNFLSRVIKSLNYLIWGDV